MRKPFEFKQFTIHQEEVTLPVTTDACLFGSFATFDHPKRILDIGSGTGLLSHFMHQKYPTAQIVGIENHAETNRIAQQNAQLNQYPIQFLLQDLFTFEPTELFDAVISNPPFFQDQLESPNSTRNAARHFQDQSFESFFSKIGSLLSENGVAWILLPATMENQLDSLLKDGKLGLTTIIRVKPNPLKNPHLIFVRLTIGSNAPNLLVQTMVHRDESNQLDETFKRLLQPFYLDKALL